MKDRLQEQLVQWFMRRSSVNGSAVAEGLGAVATTVGSRQDNQDRAIIARYDALFSNESFVFYGLCDGIGGMRDGGICASRGLATVVTGLIHQRRAHPAERLTSAASIANEDIWDIYHEQGGCTFSAIFSSFQGFASASNIGDSRIYSRTDKSIAQVTVDDNIASQLQLLGKEQLQDNAFSKQLTQYLGVGKSLQPVVLRDFKLHESGYFISSDGIHSLPPRLLAEFVLAEPNTWELAKRLTSVARWRKGSDNASIICLPSELERTIRDIKWQRLGLLEIWDSFGKLEVFVDPSTIERSDYYQPARKAQVEHPSVTDPQVLDKNTIGAKRSRRGSHKKQKAKAQIEITEHPPQ